MSNGDSPTPPPDPSPAPAEAQPPQPPQEPPAAPGPDLVAPTSDERTMAMLAHLLGVFTWFIGALLIWLIRKDTSPYVDEQGREALNFQITIGIGYVVAGFLTCISLGILSPLAGVVWIVNVVFCIMGAVAANRGERYRYPLNIRIIK